MPNEELNSLIASLYAEQGECPECMVEQWYLIKWLKELKAYRESNLSPSEVVAIKNALMKCELARLADVDGVSIPRIFDQEGAKKKWRIVIVPSNDPLTPYELREMGGKEAWFEFEDSQGWSLIKYANSEFLATWRFGFLLWGEYGKTWRAYLRRTRKHKHN